MKRDIVIKFGSCILISFVLFAGCAINKNSSASDNLSSVTVMPPLEGHWKAFEVKGEPVTVASDHEPYLQFIPDSKRVAGFSGCNRVMGGTKEENDKFSFVGMAVTRMACISPFAELEDQFLAALNSTVARRMNNNILELLDKNGKVVARFKME
ncbi:MAG: META domain-containing protein [Desulfuromonadales bacterium]|nr:META domain-containing protein [Desulfuromonadales bacterium]